MDTKRSVTVIEEHRRRRWPLAEKRRIVEETLERGASVAVVARRHAVNANQLFKWRREYERGALGTKVPALAAVKIVGVAREPTLAPADRAPPGVIEIELGADARLRVIGAADAATIAACVRAVRSS